MTRPVNGRWVSWWEPALGPAELHAAAEAVALCNTPEGHEQQLWVTLCTLRGQKKPWTKVLAELHRRLAEEGHEPERRQRRQRP